MATHIQLHRSCVEGATPDVETMLEGEPAVNLADKKLWVKGCTGELVTMIGGISAQHVAGSSGQIQFNANDGFSANPYFVIDSSAEPPQIGIGTSSPREALEVVGTIHATGISADGATFSGNVKMTSSGDVVLTLEADTSNDDENDNPLIRMTQDDGAVKFDMGLIGESGEIVTGSVQNYGFLNTTFVNSGIHIATDDIVRMTIDNVGSLGVGTTSPRSTIEAAGVVMGAGFSGATGYFSAGITTEFIWGINPTSQYIRFDPAPLYKQIFFQNNSKEYMRLTSFQENLNIRNQVVVNDLGTAVDFRVEGDDSTHLIFTEALSDKVGILTATPQESLHVVGNVQASAGVCGATGVFGTNLGVGTSSPRETLEVVGTVLATGISADGATFGGNVILSGGATFGNDIYMGGNYHFRNSAGNSVIDFEGDRNLKLGDNDSVGNDTKIHIRDSHTSIILNADGAITLGTPIVYIAAELRHKDDIDTKLRFETDTISLLAGGVTGQSITSTGTNFADLEVTRPKLKDYAETALATSSKSASFNVDFESGNVQSFTFADDLTVSFTNPPASGAAGTVTLIITNGGANTTTWHSSVKWPGDNAPALTSSGVDIVTFTTIDAGTTIYGFVGGINFS